jgi:predicted lipid-binding transport protein (Tim44 family)
MKALTVVLATFFTLSLFAFDADARRLGGARNIGKQREAISPQQAAPKAPAQQQQTAAGTPAQQPAGASKWLGPLAGLALGAGLMSLFMNNGLAGALAGLLLIAALIAAAVFVIRLLRARAGNTPLQYAGAGSPNDQINPALAATVFGGGTPANSVEAITSRWPAGFDASEFARHAKLNFVRLQAAHDARDLTTMRDFLTPEMYAQIAADINAAGDAPQKTDVVTLNCAVLDVTTESGQYLVSVRFTGLISESAGVEPQDFSEIWHLQKPLDGQSGWLIAGIQQN